MRPLGSARRIDAIAHGVEVTLDHGWQCRILILADDLVRVLWIHDGALREPRTWSIAPQGIDVPWEGRDRYDLSGFECPPFTVDEESDRIALGTSLLTVSIAKAPAVFALRWLARGKREPFAADRASRPYQDSANNAHLLHYMARAADDRYFGLGDKTGALDKHGRRLRTVAFDALGHDAKTSDPLYKHWPYLLVRPESAAAYGLFYDTLSSATFDLGCEYDNYHGFYRYVDIDDGDLDYYLIFGPRVADVVQKFAGLSGRMAFGPRWSLGYANTAMSLTDAPDAQARLGDFLIQVARHDIPLSAFHFGSGYTSIGTRRYVFHWNRDKFPDPRALTGAFAAAGIRLVANIKPCLLDDHPAYAEVARQGALVRDGNTQAPCVGQFWDGEGAHIDFTHRAGIDWWQRGVKEQLIEVGIGSAWNDNNEYEIWDDDGQSAGFGSPIPIARSRALQPLLMTRASYEAQARSRPSERVYTVTRAGPPGIQRYAQTWSGDNTTSWHTLRWNIRMGLNMSLSGMFNTGHDVGGFHGPVPDAELLIRWTQNGAFSPRFIMNSWKAGGEINVPWLHSDALPLVRDAIRFRYRLLPYLYSLYQRAMELGEPMLRPLFYDFEDDARAFADTDDFLLGPNLLVASVVEPHMRARSVYLPQGPAAWFDFWTGEAHRAGATIVTPAPLERIPLFVPAGAMIALTDAQDYSRRHDEPSRLLKIFPARAGGRSRFTLYEDDGLTHAYRNGDFAKIDFEMTATADEIVLGVARRGSYLLPYERIRVEAPQGDERALRFVGSGIELIR